MYLYHAGNLVKESSSEYGDQVTIYNYVNVLTYFNTEECSLIPRELAKIH